MAIPSGLGFTIGSGIETTWGTAVAPTKFLEAESETLELIANRTDGKGLYGGVGVRRGSNHINTTYDVNGAIKTPLYFKGMGQLLGSLMGSLATPPVQQGATAAYLQTHALNVNNLGQSLTIQKGIPDLATGTIRPYSATGAKVVQGQFELSVDGFCETTFTIDAKDLIEATTIAPGAATLAYTTATYLTGNPPFTWGEGSISLGSFGSEVGVAGIRKASIMIKRGVNSKRYYIDGTQRKYEQVTNAFLEISGTFETDFITKTQFVDLFGSNTPQSMLMNFTGPTAIASTYFPGFGIAVPQVYFTSETPKVGGPDLIQPTIAFVGRYDDVHSPATLTYMSTDTTL